MPDTAACDGVQLAMCLHLAFEDIKQVGQLSKLLLLKCCWYILFLLQDTGTCERLAELVP